MPDLTMTARFFFTRCSLILSFSLLISCGHKEILAVHRYKLRDIHDHPPQNTLARAEFNNILHGKITETDRKEQIGEYYFARWNAPEANAPVTLNFEFLQARTASKVLRKSYTSSQHIGTHTFHLNGEEFKKNGRVLAWKLTLRDAKDKQMGKKQSYLWQN